MIHWVAQGEHSEKKKKKTVEECDTTTDFKCLLTLVVFLNLDMHVQF